MEHNPRYDPAIQSAVPSRSRIRGAILGYNRRGDRKAVATWVFKITRQRERFSRFFAALCGESELPDLIVTREMK